MKPPKPKAHFAASPEPIEEGSAVRVLCGLEVSPAWYVATGDREAIHIEGFIAQVRNRCGECSDKAPFTRERYLYSFRGGPRILEAEVAEES